MPDAPEPAPPLEFDCVECKRRIVQLCGPANEFHLCAACMTLPGWHEIPELRRLFHLDD